jgi:hypothetical protein
LTLLGNRASAFTGICSIWNRPHPGLQAPAELLDRHTAPPTANHCVSCNPYCPTGPGPPTMGLEHPCRHEPSCRWPVAMFADPARTKGWCLAFICNRYRILALWEYLPSNLVHLHSLSYRRVYLLLLILRRLSSAYLLLFRRTPQIYQSLLSLIPSHSFATAILTPKILLLGLLGDFATPLSGRASSKHTHPRNPST